ncbi:Methyl--binding domain-containing protein 4 [Mycena venus]|uniref:Methyl--binding domain-containing protein 4 n=1 Tax=Mycena venus TaxID=2733690 RepID=A0A8H6XWP6_9AGAR|nr:Methyl--binding domain-containing protein 4 [Mycena venus]
MPQTPPRKTRSDITTPGLTTDQLHQQLLQLKPCLIQESVANDPWKLLVAVTLLNKTAGKLAIPVFWSIMSAWPTAWALSQAPESELVTLIRPLGTQNTHPPCAMNGPLEPWAPPISPRKREKYPPTPISHLPGAGAYALDSYRIFCSGPASEEWKDVNPSDKELIRYLKWKWAAMENRRWTPESGAGGTADPAYLEALVSELEPALQQEQ